MSISRPPRRRNLKDEVAAYLRNQVLTGAFTPGSRVDQDQVAEELGLSKLPVREALIALESEGLVENVARRGTFVAPLQPEDVLDHYIIYGLISSLAASRAAETLTEEDHARLESLAEQMEQAEDPTILTDLNDEFHGILNRAGGSRRLTSVIRMLSQSIPGGFFETTTDWPEQANADHRRIVEALRARDADAAAEAMRTHLERGGEYAVRMLRERGFWS
jgi:DNA-binding GntR family transcriptional regulator